MADTYGWKSPPSELWIAVVGFAIYSVITALRWSPFVPFNPIALFVAVVGVNLMWWSSIKIYWFYVVMAVSSVLYPIPILSNWVAITGPPEIQHLLFVFMSPALLTCLVLSGRVRRYAREDSGRAGS